jgi:CBS domain-containing protein
MSGLSVGDVMTREVCVVRRSTPLKEVARQLVEHGVSALPVLDEEDRLLGVVSEADLVGRASSDVRGDRWRRPFRRLPPSGGNAKDLMTTPVITVSAGTAVSRAARLMQARGVKRLVVVDPEGRLVGVVSRADLVRVFLRDDDDIRREVVQDVLVRTLGADPDLVDVRVEDGVVTLNGRLRQRSQVPIAVRLTRAADGVVDVVSHLGYTIDDAARRLPPVTY